jgi:hypothetical protein
MHVEPCQPARRGKWNSDGVIPTICTVHPYKAVYVGLCLRYSLWVIIPVYWYNIPIYRYILKRQNHISNHSASQRNNLHCLEVSLETSRQVESPETYWALFLFLSKRYGLLKIWRCSQSCFNEVPRKPNWCNSLSWPNKIKTISSESYENKLYCRENRTIELSLCCWCCVIKVVASNCPNLVSEQHAQTNQFAANMSLSCF